MATVPKSLGDAGRRFSSDSRKGVSHGRGGAGNMSDPSASPSFDPVTLSTPTLKGEMYTTGRGGSGNMAKNNDAESARRAQDVDVPPHRLSISNSHVGRGGAANVFKPTKEEVEAAKRDNAVFEEEERKGESKGLAEKGKEWLFGKKN